MNFFAHGLAFLDDPYYLAGTAVPDWLCVADRAVRVRARLIDRFLDTQTVPPATTSTGQSSGQPSDQLPETKPDSLAVRLACGARQHLQDDDWFHQQRSFTEISADLGRLFRQALGPDDNFRAGFLGHIVTEMLLDRVLIEQAPDRLETYYQTLQRVNPAVVQAAVNQVATRPTAELAQLIPRFIQERFLFDYLEEQKMLFRLNQVMRRVKLPLLPESIVDVLLVSYQKIKAHHQELLPPHVLKA